MPFIFIPPTVKRRYSLDHRDFLWSRVSYDEGQTVVRTTSGTYRTEAVHDTNADDIDKVYPGGHAIPVSDQEAADLTAAGYGPYLTEVT